DAEPRKGCKGSSASSPFLCVLCVKNRCRACPGTPDEERGAICNRSHLIDTALLHSKLGYMNLNRDPADERFRDEVRAFLRETLPPDMARRNLRDFHPTKADMQDWTRLLHAKGWSAPHWPVEFGGTGWSAQRRHIFE